MQQTFRSNAGILKVSPERSSGQKGVTSKLNNRGDLDNAYYNGGKNEVDRDTVEDDLGSRVQVSH